MGLADAYHSGSIAIAGLQRGGEQRDRSEGSPKGTQRRGRSEWSASSRWRSQPGRVYRLYDVFWCDSTRPVRGGTEMNSRVQLPICFSTSQWNGHRSTFVLCKAQKYAHTIFIGTDCIMNRPPSSRFPDHPVVAHPYTFAPSNIHQWTPTIRHISLLLLNQLFPGSLCLWTKPFHPDEIIASSPVKWCVSRACYLEYV